MDQERAAYQAEIQARLPQLEKLGEVPKTAGAWSEPEWAVAQHTSWWGKPLDPQKFWKGHVMWLDDSMQDAALRHGRQFPPPPYDDPTLHGYDEQDAPRDVGGSEGPRLTVYSNNKENAFWGRFSSTHPKPPEDLQREQSMVANQALGARYYLDRGDNPARLRSQDWKEGEEIQRQREVRLGYPPEAFTDDALFWSYVTNKRQEYRDIVNTFHTTNGLAIDSFIASRVRVDARYMTDPSDAEVLKSANAWKIAYLQRLSREKVDQSYINAYLKAWNLKPGEVFTNVAVSPQPIR